MPEFDTSYRVLRRRGEPDVRSLDAYRRAGGYTALETAIREQAPEQVIQEVIDAKLRGRGGAGRLTGEKWRIVRSMEDNQKYVICNAYDADPRAWAAAPCPPASRRGLPTTRAPAGRDSVRLSRAEAMTTAAWVPWSRRRRRRRCRAQRMPREWRLVWRDEPSDAFCREPEAGSLQAL